MAYERGYRESARREGCTERAYRARARCSWHLSIPGWECVQMRPILQVTWPLRRSPCSLPAHTVSIHCPATAGGMPSAPGTGRAKRVASRYITAAAFRVIWPALPPGAQAYYARKHPLLGTDGHFGSCTPPVQARAHGTVASRGTHGA